MHGYYWRKDFFTGNVSEFPSHVSWRGNNSLDWTEMKKVLYPTTSSYQTSFSYDNFSLTPVTILPFMDCVEIGNFTRNILVGTKGAIQMFIADSDTQSSYRIHNNAVTGELISVGTLRRLGFKEIVRTKIQLSLSKIRSDKHNCQDYDGYAKCANSQVKTKLMDLLGCIPPWISNFKNATYCNQDLVYDGNSQMSVARDTLKNFYNQVKNIRHNLLVV